MRKEFPLTTVLLQDRIKFLVENDELIPAFNHVKEATELFEKNDLLKEVLLLSAEIKGFEKEKCRGVLDYETATRERRKIFFRLLCIHENLFPVNDNPATNK